MESKIFKKGEIVFKERSFEQCMYDMRSGKIGIYSHYGTPDQMLLKVIDENGTFGELGLIDAVSRSATAVCISDQAQCVKITASDFNDYFKDNPIKVLEIMQQMSQRIRELSDKVEELSK